MKNDIHEWFEMVERLRYADAIWTDVPVEIIQTHISVILLGKHRVLKLKKPVDFGFLDYTTLEKRLIACDREVALNSRLCPEIYIGTQPIIEDNKGFRFSSDGKVIDYGVLMKRLAEEQMLDHLVANDTVSEAMVIRIARKLSAFHLAARRGVDIDPFGGLEAVRFNWEENFEQTKPFIDRTISASDFEIIENWVYRWIDENEDLLNERVKHGHICDGHGDLRCESICVTNGICIFDCIEFNDRFRCADVANEAAFLAMDLAAYGRPDLGYLFFERYSEFSGDDQLFKLFSFYRCYRAFVRGKVLSFQLDEAELTKEDHKSAKEKAEHYFKIALESIRQLKSPTVIMVAGLSGTGKTSVARAIAGELGLRIVSSDAVRKSLFGDKNDSSRYGEGIYSKESTRLTYQEMFEKGFKILQTDGGVILDATFQDVSGREMLKEKAELIGANCCVIECRLNSELVRRRLTVRTEKQDGFSDATWETYQRQLADYEAFETAGEEHLVLDTEKSLLDNCRKAAFWTERISEN